MRLFVASLVLVAACRVAALEPQAEMVVPVADVVARINAASGTRLLELGPGTHVVVSKDPRFCGYHDRTRNEIGIATWCKEYGDDFVEVALVHEIGHLLGLADSTDPSSIMFERYRTGIGVDAAVASLMDALAAETK